MKILIIHDINSKRHERLIKQLEWQGIDIERSVIFIAPVYLETSKEGISQAHKNCVRYAKKNGLENVIIMEDDIRFTDKNSFNFYLEGFDLLPIDWNIYLGGAYSYQGKGKVHPNMLTVQTFSAFHFYAVNKKFYDVFLELDPTKHIDTILGFTTKSYLRFPIPSIQFDGYSENFNRHLFHEKWTKRLYLYNGKNQATAKGTHHLQW